MAGFLHEMLQWFVIIEATYAIAMIGFGVYAWRQSGIEPWSWAAAIFSAVLLAWSHNVRSFRYVRPYPHHALAWGLFPSLILLGVVWMWSRNNHESRLFPIIAGILLVVTMGVAAYEARYHHIYSMQTLFPVAPHGNRG